MKNKPKKRTTVYFDARSQFVLDEITTTLGISQTEAVKRALNVYYQSEEFEEALDLFKHVRQK